MKQIRDSNIELLRILAMLGVVILHYNNANIGGGFAYVAGGSVNWMILLAMESLSVCAVNLFLLITGYFSSSSKRADPVKAVALLLQVMVFRAADYGCDVLNGKGFSLSGLFYALLPVNYFVVMYVALYLLSPYINQLLRNLSQRQFGKLLILALVLFSVWPTLVDGIEAYAGSPLSGLSTVGIGGSGYGYTIVNFVIMYLVGAYIRRAEAQVKKRHCAAVVAVCTVVLTLMGGSDIDSSIVWSYCNPLVIGQAVAVFLLFRGISLRSKVINFLAKGSFTCFLLHAAFLGHYGIPEAVRRSPLYMLGHMLFAAITIYGICFAVHLLYDLVSKPVLRLVRMIFQKVRLDLSVEEPPCEKSCGACISGSIKDNE